MSPAGAKIGAATTGGLTASDGPNHSDNLASAIVSADATRSACADAGAPKAIAYAAISAAARDRELMGRGNCTAIRWTPLSMPFDRRRPAAVHRRPPHRGDDAAAAVPPGDVPRHQPGPPPRDGAGAFRPARGADRRTDQSGRDALQRRRVLRQPRAAVQDVVHGRL